MPPITNTPKKSPAAKAPFKPTVAHQQDMDNLSKIMYEAAERHGLCDVFFQTVEKANEVLNVPVAEPRKIGVATVSFTLTVPDLPLKFAGGSTETTLTDAQRKALENKIRQVLNDALVGIADEIHVEKYVYGEYVK